MKVVVKNMKFAIKNMKFSIQNTKFSIQNMNFFIKTMKISIKNMKLSIKNMKFSVYKVCQNSSFVLFITEFSYHMYRKNAVLNGKQKQMKPLNYYFRPFVRNYLDFDPFKFQIVHRVLK